MSRLLAPAENFSCQNCSRSFTTDKFKVCGKCGLYMYCSFTCQRAHFLDHREICQTVCSDLSNDTFRAFDLWLSTRNMYVEKIAWTLLREKLDTHVLFLPFYAYNTNQGKAFRINKYLGDTLDVVSLTTLTSTSYWSKIAAEKIGKVTKGFRHRATIVLTTNMASIQSYEVDFSLMFFDTFDVLLGYHVEKTMVSDSFSDPTVDELVAKINGF